MKPLELVVYERDEYGDYMDTIAPDGKQYLIALEDVEVYCMDKRLTDAELAAEFHAQQMEAVKAFDRAYPYGESAELDAENARIEVVERFATLPHYDDPTETGSMR